MRGCGNMASVLSPQYLAPLSPQSPPSKPLSTPPSPPPALGAHLVPVLMAVGNRDVLHLGIQGGIDDLGSTGHKTGESERAGG